MNEQALVPVQNTLQAASGWTDNNTPREWLHGLSENTRIAYTTDIADFRTHAGYKPLARVTLSDVQAYQASLSDLADTTQARKIAALKSLLTFAHDMGY